MAGAFIGAYSLGPSPTYISRVTNINQTVINQTIINNTTNITKIKNVSAPTTVLTNNTNIKNITPPNLTTGKPLPPVTPVNNIKLAQAGLGAPNAVKAPPGVKPLPPGTLKPPTGPAVKPGQAPGLGKPPTSTKAQQQLTPTMQQQIKNLPTKPTGPKPTTPGPGVKPTVPGVTPTTGPGVKPTGPGVTPTTGPGVKPTTPGADCRLPAPVLSPLLRVRRQPPGPAV